MPLDRFFSLIADSRRLWAALLVVLAAAVWWLAGRYRAAPAVLAADLRRARAETARALLSRDAAVVMVLTLAALVGGTRAVALMRAAPDGVLYIPSAGPIELSSPWRYGQLLAVTAVLAYGICRLRLGPILAAVMTAVLVTSPVSLYVLASSPIRDFFRGTFIYALVLLLGLYVSVGTHWRKASAIGVAFGLVVGWGRYYREDLWAYLGVAVFTFVALAPVSRRTWRPRAAAVAAMAAGYFIAVPPVPVEVLSLQYTAGFVTAMDGQLGLSRPDYDIGANFLDDHLYSTWEIVTRPSESAPTALTFIARYSEVLPADLLIRVAGSLQKLVELPFVHHQPPAGLTAGVGAWFYGTRSVAASVLEPLAWPLAMGASVLLAASRIQAALLHLGLLLFIAGVSIAQPWGRNYFFAELFTLWNLGVLAHGAARAQWPTRPAWRRAAVWAAGLGATTLAGVAVVAVARSYQASRVQDLLARYQAAATREAPAFAPARPGVNRTGRFLAAAFTGAGCEGRTLWPVLRYAPQRHCGNPADPADWTRSVPVAAGSTLFFPAWDGFRGVELPVRDAGCRPLVREVASALDLPLWLTASTSPDGPLYQQVRQWEGPELIWRAAPVPERDRQRVVEGAGEGVPVRDLDMQSRVVMPAGYGWRLSGLVRPPADPHWCPSIDRSTASLSVAWGLPSDVALLDSDLLKTAERDVPAGAYFVVDGRVDDGGLALGLLRDGESAGWAIIETKGPFTVVFRADTAGRYAFGVASRLYWYTYPEIRAEITRARWVTP